MIAALITSLALLAGASDPVSTQTLSWTTSPSINYFYGDTSSVVDTSLLGLNFRSVDINRLTPECDNCKMLVKLHIHTEGGSTQIIDLSTDVTSDSNSDTTWTGGTGSASFDNFKVITEDGETVNGECEADGEDCEQLDGCSGEADWDFTTSGSVKIQIAFDLANGQPGPGANNSSIDNDDYSNLDGYRGMGCSDAIVKRYNIVEVQEDLPDILLGYVQVTLWCLPCDWETYPPTQPIL